MRTQGANDAQGRDARSEHDRGHRSHWILRADLGEGTSDEALPIRLVAQVVRFDPGRHPTSVDGHLLPVYQDRWCDPAATAILRGVRRGRGGISADQVVPPSAFRDMSTFQRLGSGDVFS
jgi:hypothetical protein